jgi:hypothetical protein
MTAIETLQLSLTTASNMRIAKQKGLPRDFGPEVLKLFECGCTSLSTDQPSYVFADLAFVSVVLVISLLVKNIPLKYK